MRATGRVNGQARYGEIEIEKGGVIRGAISPFGEAAPQPSVAAPATALTPASPSDTNGAAE